MNKRISINTISKAACRSHFSPFEQNKRASLLNCRLAFYVHREHSAFNFHSDYIEQETTKGGNTSLLSMLKNSIINFFNLNASNANPATSDLNVTIDNNSQTKYRVGTVLMPI